MAGLVRYRHDAVLCEERILPLRLVKAEATGRRVPGNRRAIGKDGAGNFERRTQGQIIALQPPDGVIRIGAQFGRRRADPLRRYARSGLKHVRSQGHTQGGFQPHDRRQGEGPATVQRLFQGRYADTGHIRQLLTRHAAARQLLADLRRDRLFCHP